jgi:hypothetical protein
MGDAFQKERKSIEERLVDSKRDAMFSSFLTTAQKRLKDEGRIKIYPDVIQKAVGLGEPVPLRPGAPLAPGGSRRRVPTSQ